MLKGWNYKTMKDICKVNQGFQINISRREKYKRVDNKIYITIQHLNGVGENEYIKDKYHNASVVCKKEDVLMTRTGNTGRVVTNVEGVFHNNFFRINFDKNKINKDYLVYYLNMKSIQNLILAKAGTSTIPDLNHNDFYSIPFIYPNNIKEQKAIANVLINIDNLINSLKNTIEKKKKIKNGIMQKYLIYKEEYQKNSLGDLLNFRYGEGNVIPDNGGKYPIYGANGIVGGYTKYNAEDEIIIGHIGTPGTVMWAKGKNFVTYNGTITTAKNPKILNLKYVYYALLKLNIPSIAFGSSQPFLSYDKLKRMEIYIPREIEQQNKIEKVLTNFDNELELLEKKLQKYQKIKERMMEDLLIGKVRLNCE